jgi:hypothetical protein
VTPANSDRSGRRLDILTVMLARLAAHNPRLAFRLGSGLGAMRNRLTGRWPAAREVAALFPGLSPSDSMRIAGAIGGLEERNEVFVRCVRRTGIECMRHPVEVPDAFRTMEGPCILGTFHVGAVHTAGVALEILGKPVLALRSGYLFTPRAPVELQSTAGGTQQRAAAFARALEYLKHGGIVLMALDIAPAGAIETECLGRPLALARGPFALARMTGAPIAPLAIRWTRRGTAVVIGTPLQSERLSEASTDPTYFELGLARAASRWLEAYLRQTPSELSLGLIRELLYRPNNPVR